MFLSGISNISFTVLLILTSILRTSRNLVDYWGSSVLFLFLSSPVYLYILLLDIFDYGVFRSFSLFIGSPILISILFDVSCIHFACDFHIQLIAPNFFDFLTFVPVLTFILHLLSFLLYPNLLIPQGYG